MNNNAPKEIYQRHLFAKKFRIIAYSSLRKTIPKTEIHSVRQAKHRICRQAERMNERFWFCFFYIWNNN